MAADELYLFDGWNVLHAGSFADVRELVDALASWVALRGARGVVVFDGAGEDTAVGPLEVRFAPDADALLERLAAQHRAAGAVVLVSSDATVRLTAGDAVVKVDSADLAAELVTQRHKEERPGRLADRLDEATRARLERWRRGGR